MHFLDPVAKTVHNHAPDNRMIGIESVPGAAKVGVPGTVDFEDIVGVIV